jgi:hypothetical protein
MCSMMYPTRKEKVDDSGFPRTPDRLPELCGLYVQQSKIWKTMTNTCGPYNLGGSATYNGKSIRLHPLKRNRTNLLQLNNPVMTIFFIEKPTQGLILNEEGLHRMQKAYWRGLQSSRSPHMIACSYSYHCNWAQNWRQWVPLNNTLQKRELGKQLSKNILFLVIHIDHKGVIAPISKSDKKFLSFLEYQTSNKFWHFEVD